MLCCLILDSIGFYHLQILDCLFFYQVWLIPNHQHNCFIFVIELDIQQFFEIIIATIDFGFLYLLIVIVLMIIIIISVDIIVWLVSVFDFDGDHIQIIRYNLANKWKNNTMASTVLFYRWMNSMSTILLNMKLEYD